LENGPEMLDSSSTNSTLGLGGTDIRRANLATALPFVSGFPQA
jgi:hypothetical protein